MFYDSNGHRLKELDTNNTPRDPIILSKVIHCPRKDIDIPPLREARALLVRVQDAHTYGPIRRRVVFELANGQLLLNWCRIEVTYLQTIDFLARCIGAGENAALFVVEDFDDIAAWTSCVTPVAVEQVCAVCGRSQEGEEQEKGKMFDVWHFGGWFEMMEKVVVDGNICIVIIYAAARTCLVFTEPPRTSPQFDGMSYIPEVESGREEDACKLAVKSDRSEQMFLKSNYVHPGC